MQEIVSGVYITQDYPIVTTGYVVQGGRGLAVDCPYTEEDVQAWLKKLEALAEPAYCVLTDHHPERSIGARIIQLPLIAHEMARVEMVSSPDTYKGNANPIGSEIDRLKRVTGMGRAVPDLTFTDETELYLEGLQIRFEHHPGPMSSSIWVVIPDRNVMFIGDAVPTAEPPFLGPSLIEEWLESLDVLREVKYRDYQMVSARNGLIERSQINDAARFLRKVRDRVEKLENEPQKESLLIEMAQELLDDFPRSEKTDPQFELRLKLGLELLQLRALDMEDEVS
jgi:glyoxylase-like metal-dependent hydrolase (beta-lactamase superfamily II)